MIGVEYDLFWKLNPKSLKPFIKAFSLKQKYDDNINWMNGTYIRMAIGSVLNEKNKYPDKPMMSDKVKKEESPKDRQNEIQRKFMNMIPIINSQLRKEVN